MVSMSVAGGLDSKVINHESKGDWVLYLVSYSWRELASILAGFGDSLF